MGEERGVERYILFFSDLGGGERVFLFFSEVSVFSDFEMCFYLVFFRGLLYLSRRMRSFTRKVRVAKIRFLLRIVL